MGYAILRGEGAIREKIRELFSSRTLRHRRVVLGPLAALVPADHFPDIARNSGLFQPPAELPPRPAPGAEAVPAPPENQQRAAALESWRDFLVEEAREPEGLLCFYDRPRSKRVENCCRFFIGLGMPFSN